MKRLVGSVRVGAILVALACILGFALPAQAAGTGCLPGSLKAKLSEIRSKFGPVSVISTRRHGARIAGSGKRSLHASCRAVDFHVGGGKHSQVVAWLKANHDGGVGTYSCGMNHIHIDNGPRVRYHHCVTARGVPVGKSRYAKKRSNKQYAYAKKRGGKSYAYAKSTKGKGKYASTSRGKSKRYVTATKRYVSADLRPTLGLATQALPAGVRFAALPVALGGRS
ncbi:MAG: D-Ala-D-Ala carboxypeptidase family metallohydrolase [Hyphomicrobiaceae bacterium]|nr:D-Ala-D-Ala carboxypeptidase family metallohydrolase [Hyphomicrobiaceae bacterium]